jgi:hypothetical protein
MPVGAKRKSRFIGELKIEDCKLNICGCRFAPFFLKWKEFLKYSIFNQKYSIVTRQQKYSNTVFLPQNAQK